jgi:hypothetical protein
VHADCWSNNLLFKADSKGEPTGELLAFIDWQVEITRCKINNEIHLSSQLCHPGNPMDDIVMLLLHCTSGHLRRKQWPVIFEQYYQRLTTKLGDNYKLKCSKADLWRMYEVRN